MRHEVASFSHRLLAHLVADYLRTFAHEVASTQPLRMTCEAASTAESKPKVRSTKSTSLSIDLGTPTTLTLSFCLRAWGCGQVDGFI